MTFKQAYRDKIPNNDGKFSHFIASSTKSLKQERINFFFHVANLHVRRFPMVCRNPISDIPFWRNQR